ncbi:MAG TPA: ATP-dependent protease subunit HslV [Chloroflexota bacterium]|nr:ATP-dependent protease subunit HslV [Chloroflexota bacterium]
MLRSHATTIVAVRRGGVVAMAGDGQVTTGDIVMKHTARKLRRLSNGLVLAGFAGSVADAISLFDKFDTQVERFGGNVRKAAVELTKEWRTDRILRRLEAQLIVASAQALLLLQGDGEVIEPDDDVLAIGSGGPYALAAARALVAHTALSAEQIARAAMEIAASLCIYTNNNIVVDSIDNGLVAAATLDGLPGTGE